MKKYALFILILAFMPGTALKAQKLIEKYHKGEIILTPDASYAQEVNWDQALESYADSMLGRWVGDRKSLIIAPDGRAMVSHHFRDFYTVFSPDGSFSGELQIKDKQGKAFRSLPHLHGVLGQDILFTGLDNMGIMRCFDPQGHLIKTLHLDYSARQIIPLPGKKLALVGWVLWRDKIREFVAIVDYETNEEKIIWDHFNPRSFSPGAARHMFHYEYQFKSGGMISSSSMPFVRALGMSHPPIISNVADKLIVSIPETGEIRVYDLQGQFLDKHQIGWAKNHVSAEEQKEIQRKAIDRFKNMKEPRFALWASPEENRAARDYFVKEMEKDLTAIREPIPMPFFATIIKDSDDNLLFFEFPREEGQNTFNVWVYNDGGKFVTQGSFRVQDYELEIKPSKMVFHNGYIYALARKKSVNKGVPLRVVRFQLN